MLLYCISVAPDHSLNVADAHVMESLQRILGRDVWRKCIILLTFCDLLHDEAKEKYDSILKNHVQQINQLLKKVQTDQLWFGMFRKKEVTKVKSVVDINVDQEEIVEIVAVPVYYSEQNKLDKDSKFQAIIEILRKKGPLQRKRLMEFMFRRKLHSALVHTATGTVNLASGASLGGLVGGVAGFAAGGVGSIPGAAIGALVGGTITLSMSQVLLWIHSHQASRRDSDIAEESSQPLLSVNKEQGSEQQEEVNGSIQDTDDLS